MKNRPKHFRVPERKKVRLKQWPTCVSPFYRSKHHYAELLDAHVHELSHQQDLLYADNRYALLIIFQALDAAGKDGAIKHVMSGVNPQGCQVHSFKQPSPEELEHDFLWRTTCHLPERGHIGIFNRSYYEEVLIARVHPEILAHQRLPSDLMAGKSFWKKRYRSIVELEKHLHRNGTNIIKFYLHVSKEEQRRRFLARIDEPAKNWKFSQSDLAERNRWNDYLNAYEECLTETSLEVAPWYIVPADDKENARLIISQIILDTLRALKMSYPTTTAERRKELKELRKQLVKG